MTSSRPSARAVLTPTVSRVIADEVIRRGATTYGLMGNGNAFFLDALVRAGARVVTVRHEAAAVAAADTAWRVGRTIAVASVTYGAGFTNTVTALAEAVLHRTPLVVVAGDQPTTGARPWDVDQTAIVHATGGGVVTVSYDSVREDVARAFDRAMAERVPVVLLLPYDLATVAVPPVTGSEPASDVSMAPDVVAHTPEMTPFEQDAATLAEVVTLLATAQRPLLVAGDGARDARDDLVTLADRLDALTATTAIAKGTFAGRDGDLGVCGGFAAPDSAALIAEADVVLVVGAGLNQFTMAFGQSFGPDATVIQIDLAHSATHPRVDVYVAGHATKVAGSLSEALPRLTHDEWRARGRSAGGHDAGAALAPEGRLDPRSLFQRLNRTLPADRTVVQDGGHFSGWAPMFWDMPGPGRFHMVGTAYQSIGLGLAAALGAVVTSPDDLTVLVAGDGGFLMSLPDLESVARSATHCLILVVNDGAYGAEVHQYGARGVHPDPMDIGGVDFATLARGVGAIAATITCLDDLTVLDDWLAAGATGTLLLDCLVSPTIVAPYMTEIVRVAAAAEASHRDRFASTEQGE